MSTAVGVAVCNTPQGHKDEIRHAPHERVDFLHKRLDEHGIGVLVMLEFGPLLLPRWKAAHGDWSLWLGSNNNMPGQKKSMVAIAWREELFPKMVDHTEYRHWAKTRWLHSPAVLLEQAGGRQQRTGRSEGITFTGAGKDITVHGTVTDHGAMPYATAHIPDGALLPVFGMHRPRLQDAAWTVRNQERRRRLMDERLIGHARAAGDSLVLADRNTGETHTWTESGFRRGLQNNADQGFGRDPNDGHHANRRHLRRQKRSTR